MRIEAVGHILLGILAELTGLHLLLDWREWRQLPPENDRYPVLWCHRGRESCFDPLANSAPRAPGNWDEYWSKVRVLDTMTDMWEYSIGRTIGWWLKFPIYFQFVRGLL